MRKYTDIKPIGLYTPCREIEDICAKSHLYKRCGLRPKHLILPLDAGCGRTTFVEYMAKRYKEAGILSFSSGLDDFLEIVFDGTLQQLRQAFCEIKEAAIYANEYGGLVAMDVSKIASHLGETQYMEFLKNCQKVSTYACMVFFVQATPTKNEERLLEKLTESVNNIKRLQVEPYTKEDLCDMIGKTLLEHGVEIRHEPLFRLALLDLLGQTSSVVINVRQAISLAETLVEYADFSTYVPWIDADSLKAMRIIGCEGAERSALK